MTETPHKSTMVRYGILNNFPTNTVISFSAFLLHVFPYLSANSPHKCSYYFL